MILSSPTRPIFHMFTFLSPLVLATPGPVAPHMPPMAPMPPPVDTPHVPGPQGRCWLPLHPGQDESRSAVSRNVLSATSLPRIGGRKPVGPRHPTDGGGSPARAGGFQRTSAGPVAAVAGVAADTADTPTSTSQFLIGRTAEQT